MWHVLWLGLGDTTAVGRDGSTYTTQATGGKVKDRGRAIWILEGCWNCLSPQLDGREEKLPHALRIPRPFALPLTQYR